jgi:hypothetical protein
MLAMDRRFGFGGLPDAWIEGAPVTASTCMGNAPRSPSSLDQLKSESPYTPALMAAPVA